MNKEITMHTVLCDNCGIDSNCNTDYSCYATKEDANEVSMNLGWISEGEKHYCIDCYRYDNNDKLIIGNLEIGKIISFDEFIQHGKNNGANIVNNMPWSWKINGFSVTHENDDKYIVQTIEGSRDFERGESIAVFETGLKVFDNSCDTHSPGGCPM